MTLPGATFDGRFFERHPLFWPIARAASAFAEERDWPDVTSYSRGFSLEEGARPRFEPAPPRARGRRGEVDPSALYDARIVLHGCVPTRSRSWHDFLNALVWATFPRAKQTLHERQHRAVAARIPSGARTLPPSRSREHDALALLDEGGVVVVDGLPEPGRGTAPPGLEMSPVIVFGHGVYEGLVLGQLPVTACAIHVGVDEVAPDASRLVSLADAALAERLTRGELDPAAMPRIRVPLDDGGRS
jgi:hypothetical protein